MGFEAAGNTLTFDFRMAKRKKKKTRFTNGNSSHDHLGVYFDEVGRYRLLTRKQERELSIKISVLKKLVKDIEKRLEGNGVNRDPADSGLEKLRHSAENLLLRCKSTFVTANLSLVVKIARNYIGRGVSLADLIQEGNLGLLKAVDKFSWERGCRFSTYAWWWINKSLSRALRSRPEIAGTPKRKAKISVTLLSNLTYDCSRSWYTSFDSRDLVSREATSYTGKRVGNPSIIRFLSLDPVKGNRDCKLSVSHSRYYYFLTPEKFAETMQRSRVLEVIISTLDPLEEEVVRMRYGIGRDIYTLDKIATKYNVTRDRVYRTEKHALGKIREKGKRFSLHLFTE